MAGEESRSSSYQHQVVRVASHSVVPAGHKLCAALSATAEDLAELEALFAELEEKISGNGIPASPSAFVHKQVAAIRDALRQYPIGGSVALRRATRAMAADIRLDEDEIRHAAQAGDPAAVAAAGSSLQTAWDKAAKIAGEVEKFSKAGKPLLDFGAAVSNALPSS